jgi:vacuolar-type H+-ATPase subunit H
MTYKTLGLVALLTVSSMTLMGCEQAEKSAQQLMGQAAETAKKAIDDTHKAAEQAISEATGGLISPEKKPADNADETKNSTQTI